MTEPTPDPEPPLVIPVQAEPPLVIPVPPAGPARPWPGFLGAALLTFGYWLSLIGPMILVVAAALGWFMVFVREGEFNAYEPLAWSLPVGYLGGLVFTVVTLRIVVGKGWTRDIGLRRLPPLQLLLGLVALPAFVILSDVLSQLVKPLDTWVFRQLGFGDVGDQSAAVDQMLHGRHWLFAVVAIGLCPGLVEELWCRGFLSRGLVGRYGWVAGVALTSLFFGLLHLWPPSYVLVTAAMGAALHYAYVVSRSLWVPVTIHLINNSFAALAAVKAVPTEGIERAAADHAGLVIGLAVGLLLSAGLAMWTARARLVGEDGGPARPVHRGVIVPPPGSGVGVVDARPRLVWAAPAVGFSAALVWLLAGG